MRCRLACVAGLCVAAALGCGSYPFDVGNPFDTCSGSRLYPDVMSLDVGGTVRPLVIRSALDVEYATCRTASDDPAHYMWSSANTQVATVDATGLVRGIAPGLTIISADGRLPIYYAGSPAEMRVSVIRYR